MNCEEVQRCADAFRDSELDTKAILEIQDHLADCGTCRRELDREGAVDWQIAESLRAGLRTEAMWAEQEMLISKLFGRRATVRLESPKSSVAAATAAAVWWRELLWPSPRLYLGAIVCWAFMFLVQGQLGGPRALQDREASPPSSLVTMAVMEQREALIQLLGLDEKENNG